MWTGQREAFRRWRRGQLKGLNARVVRPGLYTCVYQGDGRLFI